MTRAHLAQQLPLDLSPPRTVGAVQNCWGRVWHAVTSDHYAACLCFCPVYFQTRAAAEAWIEDFRDVALACRWMACPVHEALRRWEVLPLAPGLRSDRYTDYAPGV